MNKIIKLLGVLFLIISCNEDNLKEKEEPITKNEFIEWDNTIGGFQWDSMSSIEQTSDGGFIIGGSSSSVISGDKTENSFSSFANDYWVLKLDRFGNVEWQKTLGGEFEDNLSGGIVQLNQGGYILAGTSTSDKSGNKTENNIGPVIDTSDYWVLKLKEGGSIDWQKTIGGTGHENAKSVIQTSDGGFLVGGDSNSNADGLKNESSYGGLDYWLVKLDQNGTIVWQKTIGSSGKDNLKSIIETNDGGYIIGGSSSGRVSGNKTVESNGIDFWVVKINSNGDIQWQDTYGGAEYDHFASVLKTNSGDYILGGNYGNDSALMVKINSSGTELWSKIFEITDSSGDFTVRKIIQTKDNSFVIAGTLLRLAGNSQVFDYCIIKLDEQGNYLNQIIFRANGYDDLFDLNQTSDGGYIIGGISNSDISADKSENTYGQVKKQDIWILKISSEF